MKTNRGVIYKGPGKVAVEGIPYPTLVLDSKEQKRTCEHGAILKCIATNICGSDQHMVRGRTTASPGLVLGHEITGIKKHNLLIVSILRNPFFRRSYSK